MAALTPMSMDGMIVAASTTLLADSRGASRGWLLPWALLVADSMASLAPNVSVAEPNMTGLVIAAWPSFAFDRRLRSADASGRLCRCVRAEVKEVTPLGDERAGSQYQGPCHCERCRCAATQDGRARHAAGCVAVGPGQPRRERLASLRRRHRRPVRLSRAWGRMVRRSGLVGELGTCRADQLGAS